MKNSIINNDLVLVRPGVLQKGESHWSKFPPLGIGYLASCCEKQKILTKVVDSKLEMHITTSQTVERILSYNPIFVGITALTIEYLQAFDIASKLKSVNNNLIIILGGAHANALYSEIIKETDVFDFIIAGEAEHRLPKLINNIIHNIELKENIPGIVSNNGIIGNCSLLSSDNLLDDLNNIPFPSWDKFPKTEIYPIITERGCPYKCVFCSHNSGYQIRSRRIDDIIKELEWVNANFSPREIHFEDESFGINPERAFVLLDALIRFNKTANIEFKAQTRANIVNPTLIKKMKEAGFKYISLGIESGDNQILKNSKKGINTNQIIEAVNTIKKIGLKTQCFFILGLPGENKQSIKNTQKLAVKLNPNKLSVSIITPYPGTKVFDWAKNNENGYQLSSVNWNSFDKYMGTGISVNKLSNKYLKLKQVETYLKTYLFNFRIKELFFLIIKNYSVLFSFIKSLFKS
jgi:anaerobic magnesium-protoporphyrin IX monomethyl ester cyclase